MGDLEINQRLGKKKKKKEILSHDLKFVFHETNA